MLLTLKSLCEENGNLFRLKLRAGASGFRNVVTWVYVLEDDYIIPYFHGAELAATTGIKAAADPAWLETMVRELAARGAAGLIVNTGKYVPELPRSLLDYCDAQDFPLLDMPWEIHMTEMIQTFCTRIIQARDDSALFERTLLDAVHRRGSEEEHRRVLGRHFDPDGSFQVFLIYAGAGEGDDGKNQGMGYAFINRVRRFKTVNGLSGAKFVLLTTGHYQMLVAGNVPRGRLPELMGIILESRGGTENFFVGAGSEVMGLANISRSFQRARTAIRMAAYRGEPYVHFEDMGVYQILFSVKDEEVLSSYAGQVLRPLEAAGERGEEYLELLKAYIENDRSLERTAEALYLHRNTVNYRLQKMKALLDSPLKTVEDLFPYQVALAIRDMETRSPGKRKPLPGPAGFDTVPEKE